MRYYFFGNYFRFPMELESMDDVLNVVNRCQQVKKVQDYWISRRVRRVVDEDGETVYPPKKNK